MYAIKKNEKLKPFKVVESGSILFGVLPFHNADEKYPELELEFIKPYVVKFDFRRGFNANIERINVGENTTLSNVSLRLVKGNPMFIIKHSKDFVIKYLTIPHNEYEILPFFITEIDALNHIKYLVESLSGEDINGDLFIEEAYI